MTDHIDAIEVVAQAFADEFGVSVNDSWEDATLAVDALLAAGVDGDGSIVLTRSGDAVTVDGLRQVGWRSHKTGNLFRPGPESKKQWTGDGYEPTYAAGRFAEPWDCSWCGERHRPMDACRRVIE